MVAGVPDWLTGAMTRNAWRLSAAWMLLFAGIHTYWGLGGTALLPPGISVRQHPALLVIDLVAVPLCLAGAVTTWLLRPGQRHGKLRQRAWLLWPAQVGTAVMLGHVLSNVALVL